MFAWDDLAVFLAVYRERTTTRAAAALGFSQPTVVRRLGAIEQQLGVSLFERTPGGLVPTPAAERLIDLAARVEHAVSDFRTEAESISGAGANIIRLTFLDHFERLLVPILRSFRERWPRMQTHLLASDRLYDLARGEADIGVRGRHPPTGEDIVVHELPPTGWTLFAASHLGEQERPRRPEEVCRFPIALIEGAVGQLPVYRWLEGEALKSHFRPIRCANYPALKSVVASGAAISVLPCTIGEHDSNLVRCWPPMPEFDVPIYLAAKRAVLRRPAVRDLFDTIATHFEAHPELLGGKRN
jgi:DNA-binding transcriptional LysR family regulator